MSDMTRSSYQVLFTSDTIVACQRECVLKHGVNRVALSRAAAFDTWTCSKKASSLGGAIIGLINARFVKILPSHVTLTSIKENE